MRNLRLLLNLVVLVQLLVHSAALATDSAHVFGPGQTVYEIKTPAVLSAYLRVCAIANDELQMPRGGADFTLRDKHLFSELLSLLRNEAKPENLAELIRQLRKRKREDNGPAEFDNSFIALNAACTACCVLLKEMKTGEALSELKKLRDDPANKESHFMPD